MKNIYLTVSDFAELHNVNRRTLHYYDSVGLFSPEKTGENGYRYYTYAQSSEFQIILTLRDMGMSIEEIKEYRTNRSPEVLGKFLTEKIKDAEEKIRHFKNIQSLLMTKKENLLLSQSEQINKIDIVTCKPEYLILTDIAGITSDDDPRLFHMIGDFLGRGRPARPFNTGYGAVISKENLLRGNFEEYSYLFTRITEPQDRKSLFKRPGGTYLRGFCKGSSEGLPKAYKRIADYAADNRIEITGPAYEEGINEMSMSCTEERDGYVVRIMMECKSE